MDFTVRDKDLARATSRIITEIIIARQQKLEEQIESGVYKPLFRMIDLIEIPGIQGGSERKG